MHILDEYYEENFHLLVIVKNSLPCRDCGVGSIGDFFLKRFLNWAIAPEEGKGEKEVTKCS